MNEIPTEAHEVVAPGGEFRDTPQMMHFLLVPCNQTSLAEGVWSLGRKVFVRSKSFFLCFCVLFL